MVIFERKAIFQQVSDHDRQVRFRSTLGRNCVDGEILGIHPARRFQLIAVLNLKGLPHQIEQTYLLVSIKPRIEVRFQPRVSILKASELDRPYRSDLKTVVALHRLSGGGRLVFFCGGLLLGAEITCGHQKQRHVDEREAGPV